MPEELTGLRVKAQQLFEQGKFNELIEMLTDVLLQKYKDAELYTWRARAHDGIDQPEEAALFAQKAIDLNSNYWMGYFARGNVWSDKGEYDKAIADYNKAIELKPDDATAYYNRGIIWNDKGEYDKAIADYNKTIELKPDYADAYNNRGIIWNDKGEYDKAIADYNKAIELKPNYADAYNNRGIIWNDKGEYDKAIADYNKAIELKPDYATAYYNRGTVWSNKGEYDKAIADYNKAIELKPDYATAYYNRGTVWSNKGEYDKAIANYNKAIELKPNYATAYYNRGTVWSNKGEHDKAIADYNKAIELKPDYADAYNNRGIIWNDKGEYDKAIADYNKAIELKPDDATAYYNRGLAYELNRDFKSALDDFQKVVVLNFRVSDAKYIISYIKDRLAVTLNEEISKDIEKIKNIVNAIRLKTIAGSEISHVVHYSKLLVANIITNDSTSRMHYSNVIYMNDPQEGKTFLEYLNDKKILSWYEKSSYRNESTIFLGSFLPAGNIPDNVEESAEDQLLMWRTYGKDETGLDAGGCNFVINASFFQTEEAKTIFALPKTFKAIKQAIEKGIKIPDDNRNSLLKVQYIRKDKIITDDKTGIITQLIEYLKEEIKKLIDKNEKENIDAKLFIESRIFDAIQELSHLFKSADYSFEKEVRIIKSESRNSPNIEYYKDSKGNELTPPRHFFVKSEKRILPYLSKMYLGPKVKNANHWSLHLDYSLRKAARNEEKDKEEIRNLEGKITPSTPLNEEDEKRLNELKSLYTGTTDLAKERTKPNEIDIIPSKCKFV